MEQQMKLFASVCLLVLSIGFLDSCYGKTFYVGGEEGWVLDPHETYNHWAQRNRFQVNDTLVFKYKKGLDSVLVVKEEAYKNCNKTSPKEMLEDGNSIFKFKRSGPFFFISGHDDKCKNGEKLVILVMGAVHHTRMVHVSAIAPPTLAPVGSPATPQKAMLEGIDGQIMHAPAPAPAPTSGITGVTSSVGLILGLGFCLIWF